MDPNEEGIIDSLAEVEIVHFEVIKRRSCVLFSPLKDETVS